MRYIQALTFLPLAWASVAVLVWREQLKAPVLFVVVALLVGFGAQAVASFLWLLWQATNNQFVAVPAAKVPQHLASIAVFKAIATVVIVTPIYWLLSKRL